MKQLTKAKNNLYLILDIMPGSSHSEILHAYGRAKRTYSGDSLAGYSLIDEEVKAPIMDEIENAFKVLGNPVKRREYDIEMGFETWRIQDEEDLRMRGDSKSFLSKPSIRTLEENFSLPGEVKEKPSSLKENLPKETVNEIKVVVNKTEKNAASSSEQHRAEVVPLPTAYNSSFESNPQFETEIKNAEDIDGAFLKAVRIYRRLSMEQLAQRCKLQPVHVVAIEEEDPTRIPHQVYLRGHVLMICQVLEFPQAEHIAKNFVARMKMLGKLPKSIF